MPEGPEVETIRRSLEPLLRGRRVLSASVSKKKLRLPVTARAFATVIGRPIEGLARRGKLLIIDVEGERGLFVRLGMTGKLTVAHEGDEAPPHTHVRLRLDQGERELRFSDPRRFGSVAPFSSKRARDAALAALGPNGESLSREQSAQVDAALARSKRSLKDALLDQSLVAGVGNIYASEALFMARLSPFRRGVDLSSTERSKLLQAVARVLRAAVGRRGTTFSDYVDGLGVPGDNLAHLSVFQREGLPCRRCHTPVVRVAQGQRSTFFCPRCQGVPLPVSKSGRQLG